MGDDIDRMNDVGAEIAAEEQDRVLGNGEANRKRLWWECFHSVLTAAAGRGQRADEAAIVAKQYADAVHGAITGDPYDF